MAKIRIVKVSHNDLVKSMLAEDYIKPKMKFIVGYSEESTCIGGVGSKPAFEILRELKPRVQVKRSYTIYKGHVGFEVLADTRDSMKLALKMLNSSYSWIDETDHFDSIEDFEKMWS